MHTVLSVDREELEKVPQLQTEIRERIRVERSLVHAIIHEVMRHAVRSLHFPTQERISIPWESVPKKSCVAPLKSSLLPSSTVQGCFSVEADTS